MDAFDYTDDKSRFRRLSAGSVINLLAGILFLAALCAGLVMVLIVINPHSALNPFPPPTLPALIEFPTPTPTPRSVFPPTWTPTITNIPTSTNTPQPPTPLAPTPTPTQVIHTSPPAPTLPGTTEPVEGAAYVVQQGNPASIFNIAHPGLGCNWTGVGGQVIGLNSAPVIGLIVQLGGTFNSQPVDKTTLTGAATQYGRGGYEFVLGDKPSASTQKLWVQLLSQEMTPITEKVFFDTFGDCENNLVLISFNQVR